MSAERTMQDARSADEPALQALEGSTPPKAVRALAVEVVRRLRERASETQAGLSPPRLEDVDRLCDALLSKDQSAAGRMVDSYVGPGPDPARIAFPLLAEAARRLGQLWTEDEVSFLDVTVGVSRIFAIVHVVSRRQASARSHGGVAVFASVPGDTHTLGVTIAAEFLRSRGWEIVLRPGCDQGDLLADIAALDPWVVGLSASPSTSMVSLGRLIAALRIRHPHTRILIGGSIAAEEEAILKLIGADAVATDLDSAHTEMERLSRQLPGAAVGIAS